MSKRIVLWMSVFLSPWMLTACTNMGLSSSSTTRYYILDSISTSVPSSEKEANQEIAQPCGVGPVTIPSYLNRPQMVTRVGGNEIQVEDFCLWAEPLKENITRVMAKNVAFLTGSEKIYTYPWKGSDKISLQIVIDLFRFDADVDGNVTLTALWRIVDRETAALLVEKQFHSVKPSLGKKPEQVVDAMSQTLIDLSQEVADTLASLNQPKRG